MNPVTILLADIVPLQNKGEEAIVRGIEDLFRGATGAHVRIGLFDEVHSPRTKDGITSFPLSNIFPFGDLEDAARNWASLCRRKLPACLADVFLRADNQLARVVRGTGPKDSELRTFFADADVVLAGHDGAFNVFSCGFLNFAKQEGKPVGILGTGSMGFNRLNFPRRLLYKRAVALSDFCYIRERSSFEFLDSIGTNMNNVHLAPDPAFAMEPAAEEEVESFLASRPCRDVARREQRRLVAVTVCEHSQAISASYSQPPAGETSDEFHARVLGKVFDHLVGDQNLFLVFLPHSIGGWSGDDRAVAQRVRRHMVGNADHTEVLEDDLSPRLLKGIIGKCDMLIAERLHSAIGAVGVGTPFCMLTNQHDTRSHDILGDMCGCPELIVNTENPTIPDLQEQLVKQVKALDSTRELIHQRGEQLRVKLQSVQDKLASVLLRRNS